MKQIIDGTALLGCQMEQLFEKLEIHPNKMEDSSSTSDVERSTFASSNKCTEHQLKLKGFMSFSWLDQCGGSVLVMLKGTNMQFSKEFEIL